MDNDAHGAPMVSDTIDFADPFANHPLSYPLRAPPSNSLLSAALYSRPSSCTPSFSLVSSNISSNLSSNPSDPCSYTSCETSWFDDDDSDDEEFYLKPTTYGKPATYSKSPSCSQPVTDNQPPAYSDSCADEETPTCTKPAVYHQPSGYNQQPDYDQQPDYNQQSDYTQQPDFKQDPDDYNQSSDYKQPSNYNQPADYNRPSDYSQPSIYNQPAIYNHSHAYDRPSTHDHTANHLNPSAHHGDTLSNFSNDPSTHSDTPACNKTAAYREPPPYSEPATYSNACYQKPLTDNHPSTCSEPSTHSDPSTRSRPSTFSDSDSDLYDHSRPTTYSEPSSDGRTLTPTDSLFLDSDEACTFDKNDWFAQFDGHLDISDDPPSRAALTEAGQIPLYDSAGNTRLFSTLFSQGEVVGNRQLLIFIRHFYCGACKAYIDALSRSIPTRTSQLPTSIVIIGCGSPTLIRHYKATTQCPFPIFADPSRQIFRLLGMRISLNVLGRRRPQYMSSVPFQRLVATQWREMTTAKGQKRLMGGNVLQIGGEFLFENGEVTWCHRMRNYRGHSEVDVLRRILDVTR